VAGHYGPARSMRSMWSMPRVIVTRMVVSYPSQIHVHVDSLDRSAPTSANNIDLQDLVGALLLADALPALVGTAGG
jgi:hypothetical protein